MHEATPLAASSSGEYNYIYKLLVEDESDVLGVIAYSVYKRQKIEYIESIRKKHNRRPNEQELESFHALSNSPTQLDTYKNQAMTLARIFLRSAVSKEAEKLSSHFEEQANQKLASFKPRFWIGVAQSVIGSIGFVLLMGVLVIFTWSLNHGPKQVIENIFDVTISSNTSVQPVASQ